MRPRKRVPSTRAPIDARARYDYRLLQRVAAISLLSSSGLRSGAPWLTREHHEEARAATEHPPTNLSLLSVLHHALSPAQGPPPPPLLSSGTCSLADWLDSCPAAHRRVLCLPVVFAVRRPLLPPHLFPTCVFPTALTVPSLAGTPEDVMHTGTHATQSSHRKAISEASVTVVRARDGRGEVRSRKGGACEERRGLGRESTGHGDVHVGFRRQPSPSPPETHHPHSHISRGEGDDA